MNGSVSIIAVWIRLNVISTVCCGMWLVMVEVWGVSAMHADGECCVEDDFGACICDSYG